MSTFVAVSVSTHLGDLEDDGLGSLARAGDVDVHVAVDGDVHVDGDVVDDVQVAHRRPLHLLLSLHCWTIALQI